MFFASQSGPTKRAASVPVEPKSCKDRKLKLNYRSNLGRAENFEEAPKGQKTHPDWLRMGLTLQKERKSLFGAT